MARRLGLDIGTNSIGWCLIEDDAYIVDIGVRIFTDGRDPKSKASLAVARRDARAMRRRRDRYLGRRSAFLEALVAHGLMPAEADEAKLLAARDPYGLRKRALTERLEPYEICRALFHLNQRRGFKSNRKADRKSGEAGVVERGAQSLDRAMAEAGADTLGAFLADQPVKRVRMESGAQDFDFYPQRRHTEHEFARIWDEQARHHPDLLTEEARAALYRILFFQRPLKEVAVGFCLFAGRDGVPRDEARLPKAHPLFQERRLYEEVNQLEITSAGEPSRKLTVDQRDTLVRALRGKRTMRYTAMAKLLKLQPGESFNKASETRTEMLGDEVRAAMADDKRFGAGWAHLPVERQWTIIDRVLEEEDPETLHAFLTQECGLDEEHAGATAKALLPEGHGRIGETASRRILEELKREVVTYSKAVERCGWHHSDERTGEILDRLPYYGELLSREIPPGSFDPADAANPEAYWGRITNPTVHIGLRQIEKLVNAIIERHGRPDTIVVELARELKLNDEQREEHNKRIRKDTAAAERRGRILEEEGFANNGRNRALLKQWEELNPANPLDRRCPYCAEPIGPRQLFSGSGEADIDHIIPYSRSLDDSGSNKVVAHRSCNRAKGNRTPYERWGHDPDKWETISGQVARLHKSRQWRFGPDAMARVEKDGGFLARQLTDTQYLSRLAGKYLRSLYADKDAGSVYVIPGRMTAMLRRTWGLNSLLPDHNYVENEHSNAPKNRLDHRHHAIDAAVIAVTTRSLLNSIAHSAARSEELEKSRLTEDVAMPWEGFRDELYERVNAITVSHKPDHGRTARPERGRDSTAGRLHNDTAYGFTGNVAADGKTPIVVHRVPLTSLKPGDISDAGRIPDETLREALYAATRDATGPAFLRRLEEFSRRDGPFKGLRHLRVREPLNVIPIRDATGRAYKGYKGDANARFDIWQLPDGKWVSDVVSMFEAHQADAAPRRPHPAAKRIMSLRQNDMVRMERNGAPPAVYRVVKFTFGQIAFAADNEAGALKDRDAKPQDADPFKYIRISAGALQKSRARQVRVDPLGRIAFDPGPRA